MIARSALEFTPGAAGPVLEREAEWQDRAACAEVDPELFFPRKGGSVRAPKRICASCEVRAECLEFAIENEIHYGIWGGTSDEERRRIKRNRVRAALHRCCAGLHLMTGDNTLPDGRCRTCKRDADRRWHADRCRQEIAA